MSKNRFSKSLMVGKVATFPLLLGQAYGASLTQVQPAYTDMISAQLHVIEIPTAGNEIQLGSIATGVYGNVDAAICSNTALPARMSIVVTGVTYGQTVYLAAASDSNAATYLAVDPRLKIGTTNLTFLGTATAQVNPGTTTAVNMRNSVVIDVNTAQLQAIALNGSLYLQAVIMPSPGAAPSTWTYSELDHVAVGVCQNGAYGGYGTSIL